jgi:molecular chaperone GrpE
MTNDENRPDAEPGRGTTTGADPAQGEGTDASVEEVQKSPAEEGVGREVEDVGGGAEAAVDERKATRAREDSTRKLTKKEIATLFKRSADKLAHMSAQNEQLKEEVKDLKDKWLRSLAEFENYRKRTRKEWELLQQRSKADSVLDILSVVDDFERALSVVGERDDEFIRGIRLIYNNLVTALERIGVRKIEALSNTFDPTYHMAVAQIEREGAVSDQIVEVIQNGYCLGDLVVRPAKVVIAK